VSQNRHRLAFFASPRRRAVLVPVAIALVAVIGLVPALKHRAENQVIRHSVTEMPKLDTGVLQPVHVTFTGDTNPAVGQAASLRFVVTSGAANAEIHARIVPPDGASVARGSATWDGQLSYQEVAEIPVSVLFPGDKAGFVRGEVTTRLPDGQLFKSATAVWVDPAASDTQIPEPRTLIDPTDPSKNIDVVVYKNK
jgi:hypothetical protein